MHVDGAFGASVLLTRYRDMLKGIEHGFALARWAEEELRATPEVEIVSPAQMAMVNFRFAPAGTSEEERDELNARAAARMRASGYAGVFTTELSGKKVLRLCAIHPRAHKGEMREVVRRLAAFARE